MNTHDDLLNCNDDMCSLCGDDVSDMCSKEGHDTCGDGSFAFTGLRQSALIKLEIKGFLHFGVKADEG